MKRQTEQLKISPKLKRVLTHFYGLQRVGANAVCDEMNGWLDISLSRCREDNDNIYSLTWRCIEELDNKGYRSAAIHGYTLCGFVPILFYFTTRNTMKYDASAIADFIGDMQKVCQSGAVGVSMLFNLRIAAKILQTYHDLGDLPATGVGLGKREKRCLSPEFENLLNIYKSRNGEFRSVSERTTGNECHSVKTFLWYMERCGVRGLSEISRLSINDCFTKLAPNYVDGAKRIANEVKHFFTFLCAAGITSADYGVSIPQSFPSRRKLRFGFTKEEIPVVLGGANRGTKRGRRDYAIMLIAARTGLRACDVAKLKLSEIDWHGKEIRIVQQKTDVPLSLSLTAEVGNAIVDYFENSRGAVDSPYMFPLPKNLRKHIKSPTVSALTTKYMNIAGIDGVVPYRGVHSFRRSFGKRLLDAQLTPDMLMEMLGQVDPNSIKPYTMIHEDGLRRCALPLSSVCMEGAI